jgi:hypothetical protein
MTGTSGQSINRVGKKDGTGMGKMLSQKTEDIMNRIETAVQQTINDHSLQTISHHKLL